MCRVSNKTRIEKYTILLYLIKMCHGLANSYYIIGSSRYFCEFYRSNTENVELLKNQIKIIIKK